MLGVSHERSLFEFRIPDLHPSVSPSGSTASTVTVLTPRGRSAVAVVSARVAPEVVDADPPLFRAANARTLVAQPLGRVCFGQWGTGTAEDVVVCRVHPDTVEISCHGGIAAVARIVRDLESRGCRSTTWQASLHESQSPVAADCLQSLTHASTFRTAAILLEQANGVLEQAIANLLNLEPDSLHAQLDDLLRWADFGQHLTQPWRVVLAGLPNVGKSSLINQLVGYQRSIVYAEPGTTRDVVTAAAVVDGWPVELSDTAGLRDNPGEIEAAGIIRAREQLANADLAVVVLDRSRPIDDVERRLIADLPRFLIVEHKADLASAWTGGRPATAIAVSSLSGDGVEQLIARIAAQLVPKVPPAGTALPVSQRQVVCLRSARAAVMSGNADAAQRQLRELLGRS